MAVSLKQKVIPTPPETLHDALRHFRLHDPSIKSNALANQLGLRSSFSQPFLFFGGGSCFVAARWKADTVVMWKDAEIFLERIAEIADEVQAGENETSA